MDNDEVTVSGVILGVLLAASSLLSEASSNDSS